MAITLKELKKDLANQNSAPVYLIQGTDQFLLDQTRALFTNLIEEEDRTMNLAQFDMRETNLAVALDDARAVPFFGDKRVVIVDNAYFLTGETTRGKIEHFPDELVNYVQQPEPQTILVIFAPYEKLDGRKKVTKLLKERASYLAFGDLTERDIHQLIQQRLDEAGYVMASGAEQVLFQRTNLSLTQIMMELEKLLLYTYDTKQITVADVEASVTNTLSQNIFDLIEALLNQRLRQAVELYHELVLNGEEPLRLHGAMIGQFRLLLQVKSMTLSEQGIATALKVHPYRVKLAKQTVRKYSYAALSNAFLSLVQMEEQLKSTSRDPELLFELFVLRYQETSKN